MIIPPGHIIRSGYVPTGDIVFPLTGATMAPASVREKIDMYSAIKDQEAYPLPIVRWVDGKPVLMDGRHRYLAHLMLSRPQMLVAWTEEPA